MAGTFTNLHDHFVFSTKDRLPLINADFQSRLYEYIGGILRSEKSLLLAAGGMPDHILPRVTHYIQNQEEHHRIQTFQDEFLRFLERHEIEYDERFIWK